MLGFILERDGGRDDGDEWVQDYERLPGSAGVSIILESTTDQGVGPRLQRHPYAETFLFRNAAETEWLE